MASSQYFIIAILLLSISNAAMAANPKSFFIPAFKDTVKTQYYLKPQLGSPAATFYTTIDLSGGNLFINCDIYKSSSQSRLPCHTAECDAIGAGYCFLCKRADGCNTTVDYNNCGCNVNNPFSSSYASEIVKDVMVLAPSPVRVLGFPFGCLSSEYMTGVLSGAAGARGVVGLGSGPMGLVSQLVSVLKIDRTVSVCLPSSVKAAGAVVVGSLASAVKPISLTKTPLVPYPIENIQPAPEDYIGVKSVRISGEAVAALNSSLLILDKDGIGGTKLSTTQPWTVVHPELYGPIVVGFVRKALSMKLKRVAGVRPFGACFSAASAGKTATGPAVPTIELDLNSGGQWKIYGGNSMVKVDNEVMCLGIVRSTSRFGPAILIGGHTLEDNLLELDQSAKTLRFSSSLLAQGFTCSSLPRV